MAQLNAAFFGFFVGRKKQDDKDVKRAGSRLRLVVFEPYPRAVNGESVRFRAMLVSPEPPSDNALPPMDIAYVTHLDSRGFLIRGQELIFRSRFIKSRLEYYDQLRLCKPVRKGSRDMRRTQ